jgi:GDP-L-fucose synthase
MQKNSKIYVAGHAGLVGSAIIRKLRSEGHNDLVVRTIAELDLTDQQAVAGFFAKEKPEYVFLAAAKVGGIQANDTLSAEFIYQNLLIEANVIHQAYLHKVKKLLFLGSSCIYPRDCPQPIKEEYLLTGPLEETNKAYAMAKISGIVMCQMYRKQYGCDFISAMPTNMYGPNDNYHPEHSHVFPAFIRRFHEAKLQDLPEVTCWGTGKTYREFLLSDDCADALLFLMNNYSDAAHVNVGTGKDLTVKELAELIAQVVGYKGKISWDRSKPDGTPRKLLDVHKLNKLGWRYRTELKDGIKIAYADVLSKHN